jgi:hypothetical protein
MCQASPKELVEVVRFYRDQCDWLFKRMSSLSQHIETTMLEYVMGSTEEPEPDFKALKPLTRVMKNIVYK